MSGIGRLSTLGVCGNAVHRRGATWFTHHSFGRIVELLSKRVDRVLYVAPSAGAGAVEFCDYAIPGDNVDVVPWGQWENSFRAMRRPGQLIRAYSRLVAQSDAVLLRGSWPLLWMAHVMARRRRRRVVHWIVGDPFALLRASRRGYGSLVHGAGIAFAWMEQRATRAAGRWSRAAFLVNGEELARKFRTPRTTMVISTSITEAEMLVRPDTCGGSELRVLFVGFIRPEKGLEYLLRALGHVELEGRVIRLVIVGSWAGYDGEHDRLVRLTDSLELTDRVTWAGYAPFGSALFSQMDGSDMLVLPSLSEGTPRVLVEARARSLPIISTTVGGIPSSVTDGWDGLLVPPRDAESLASAMIRMVRDGALRRRMIENGRNRVRGLTVDRFVDQVLALMTDRADGRP